MNFQIKLLILGNLDGKQKKKVINSVILYLVFLHCHGHGHPVLFDDHFLVRVFCKDVCLNSGQFSNSVGPEE